MRAPAIVASVLGADYARLGQEVAELEAAGVDRIQWDIMDGRFVPNLSFSADVVAACRPHATLPYEAHLMVEDPDPWLQPFAAAGCDTVLVHAEASRHLHRTLSRIRDLGVRSGVALSPATPLECVRHVLDQVDVLLVMTVNPGFGGQRFITGMLPKIQRARHLLQQCNAHCELEVDGGVDAQTAPLAVKAGADVLVAGTAIFADQGGPKAGLLRLIQAIQ
jgi:ribulose-phosphate 3-epimerase